MFKLKKKHLIILGFLFIAFMLIGMNKVEATSVTVTTYDELKEAVNGHNDNITDTSITEVKLGADIAIPASSGMAILVVNDFTFDLNGHTLDITNDNSSMVIYYGSNNIENFTSGSLTITDTSESQTGTIKLGIKPIGVIQQNVSNTGMHYKLTIDGGKFYGKSGAYNRFFEFNTDNSYYWKDKLITFDFKITKGYFEHVSTNMSSIILANDMKLNNITFNMSFDNLTFKSGGNRLIASNESYSIDDVVPEDTNFYIFNSSEDKQVLIAERSTSVQAEVPSSLWYEVDGYTDTSYAGIKLVKKDGFDVTAPTFDSVNYDYTSVSAKGISIYNRGTTDLQVKSVTVDEPSKFTVIGTTQPTIASKATDNTSFTIKPVDGLEAGTYTATITVTDMSDKAYTATVTLNVGAKNLPALGISIEGTISYGEEYTPTIVGAPELGVGDYEFKYAKKVGESYQDVDEKPTSIGSYKVTINVTNRNYSASGVSVFYDIVAKTITPTVDTIADQTYTGSEIKPTVVVKDGATTLIEGTDYEVTYSNNINVGTATATISEVSNGNYTFSDKDVNFTIIKKQLEKVTLRTDELVYNGLGSFPAMDNLDSNLQELSGTLGATDVGNYVTYVVLKDSANYEWVDGTTGNLTLNWKIIQATITDASVTLPQESYKITGSEIKPEPTVVVNGRTLVKDTDYTVTYTNNTNLGIATVTVTGKGNYQGTGNKNFTIVAKDPQTITFTNSTVNKTYGDSNFTITANHTVGTGTVTYSSSDTDVAEVNSTTGLVTIKKVGTTTITATANENADYAEAAVSYDLTVDKKEISYTATVKDKTYNGNVTAEVENVTFTGLVGTETLTKDTDYTVSATFVDSNIGTNKNVNVTLTLKETTKTANYKLTGTSYVAIANITGKEIQDTDVTLGTTTYTYDGTAKEPSVTVKVDENTLTKGTDYEVVYTNNVNAGTGKAKIIGMGNYSGTVNKDFVISPKSITPTIEDISAVTYNGEAQKPELVVKDGTTVLIKDTDYTVSYSNNINAGTATATISKVANSNYTFSDANKAFTINKYELQATNISLQYTTVRYDGNPKTPTVTVKVNGNTLASGTDYEVGYSNNTSIGTATVTVTGKGNYEGTPTKNFEIKNKDVLTISGIENQQVTYTGNPVSLVGTLTVSNGIAPSALTEKWYNSSDAEISKPTNVGLYKVVYSYEDDDYVGSKTVNVEITKKVSVAPTVTNKKGTAGDTLSTVSLPTNAEWVSSDEVITVGDNNYQAKYTENGDTTNYTTVTFNVNVYGLSKVNITTNVTNIIGGTISEGKVDALEGTKYTVTFTPNAGYEIDNVKVNGTLKTVRNNKLELTVGNQDINVVVTYKKIQYKITINDVENATITPNGMILVDYNSNKEFVITPNAGYKLTSVKVNGVEKLASIVDDKLVLENILSDAKIVVTVEKITYKVVEGAGQTYTITKDGEATFKINGEFSLFDKVYVDGNLVAEENYTAKSGSTIITFKPDYMNSLTEGNHTLKVTYTDGGDATTTFTIAKVAEENNGTADKAENTTNNPKTSDNIVTFVAMFIVSVLGIAITVKYNKNKVAKKH